MLWRQGYPVRRGVPPSRAAALTIAAYCDSSLPPQRRQREVPDHALRVSPSRHSRDDRLCDFVSAYYIVVILQLILFFMGHWCHMARNTVDYVL